MIKPLHSKTSAAAALGLALLAAGCGNGGAGMSAQDSGGATTAAAAPAPAGAAVMSATVDIRSFKYKPATVTVKKGGRVRFVNADNAAHTATADDRSYDTQTIDQGKTRMVSFTSAGTFPYHCDFHPFMKGTVVVK
jgi:plastocyanin